MKVLYYADNLDVLKDLYSQYPQGFIDLIYNDPPFNSKRNYNILFENIDMKDTKAQKEAFADTWSNVSYLDTLNEIKSLDFNVYNFLNSLSQINLSKSIISYLTTMSIRIWYMNKLLKESGSFYLHCDPTMSHYLKIVCDLIFGEKNFRNEIVWHYRRWTNSQKQFQAMHDIILFYSKTDNNIFNPTYVEMSSSQQKKFERGYDSNVIHTQTEKYSQLIVYNKQKLDIAIKSGKINLSNYKNVVYRDKPLIPAPDVIILPVLNSQSFERLGFPTQKPEELLDRIILASTNEGGLVADFFCGCGTTIASAEKNNRNWIGVDISHLAIRLIQKRLIDKYGLQINNEIKIYGFPKDIASAQTLALEKNGRFQFEDWIIEIMLNGVVNDRKNQTGFDGYSTFDVKQGDTTKRELIMIEVKSGHASLPQINHFIQTIKEIGGAIGVFVCWQKYITRNMLETAKKQGYYMENHYQNKYDKLQILSVEDILDNKKINVPSFIPTTFKSAKREIKNTNNKQGKLELY